MEPKRPYVRFPLSEKHLLKEAYLNAPRGMKTKVAKEWAQRTGCSTQWIVKIALDLA